MQGTESGCAMVGKGLLHHQRGRCGSDAGESGTYSQTSFVTFCCQLLPDAADGLFFL